MYAHNSADSVPTANLICIKKTSILVSQSRDLKHDALFSKHFEFIILSMNGQVKSVVNKMSVNILFTTLSKLSACKDKIVCLQGQNCLPKRTKLPACKDKICKDKIVFLKGQNYLPVRTKPSACKDKIVCL